MRVVAMVMDLMDRSRITAALDGVEFAGAPDGCSGADLVIVDLARFAPAVAQVRAAVPNARIVAFGPHVDEASLAAAQRDGADQVLPRSRFFRDIRGTIA